MKEVIWRSVKVRIKKGITAKTVIPDKLMD